MKRNLTLLFLPLLIFTSCVNKSGVEYSKVADVDLGNLKKDNAQFTSIVVFNNISEDSYVVKNLVLDLKIDGNDIGTILTKIPKGVRPHSEFSIDVDYLFETNKIIKAGEGPSDVYLVQLEGDLTLKDNDGQEITVPVKYKASYAYKTNKEERIEKRKERKEEKKKAKEEQKTSQ